MEYTKYKKIIKIYSRIIVIISIVGFILTDFNINVYAYNQENALVYQVLAVTSQPTDKSGKAGDKVTYEVKADGTGLSYQWQYKLPGENTWKNSGASSAKASKFTVDIGSDSSFKERKYRCEIKDSTGKTVYTNEVYLHVVQVLAVTSQPTDKSGKAGDKVTYEVKADGTGLSYQWQYKLPGESTWKNSGASSAKASKFTVDIGSDSSFKERKYRCEIKDSTGKTVYTNEVYLHVVQVLAVTSQPTDKSGKAGDKVTYEVKADGTGLSYQWQYKLPGESTWKNSGASSAKASKFTVDIGSDSSFKERKYRCEIKDSTGKTVYTNEVYLHVVQVLAVTSQPTDKSGKAGDKVTYEVKADGTGLSYQWQYKLPGESTWKNSGASSAKASKFTVNIGSDSSFKERKYRCEIKDSTGKTVYTNEVYLHVVQVLAVTSQPTDKSGKAGDKVTYEVKADGTGLSYQWQYKLPGESTWKNSGASSAKASKFTVDIGSDSSFKERKYRCEIKDSTGKTVYTNEVYLHVVQVLAVTSQPTDKSGKAGDKVTYEVKADGTGLSYQWQYKLPGESTWKNSGASSAKASKFTVDIGSDSSFKERKYRCEIKDSTGKTVYTNEVYLHVVQVLAVTSQPTDKSGKAGDKVTYEVKADGTGLSYQWQYKLPGESTWKNSGASSAKASKFTVDIGSDSSFKERKYRCEIKDNAGKIVYTNEVYLHVINQEEWELPIQKIS